MTPLLFWKIIGYAILGFFTLGIVFCILSAVATIVMPIFILLLYLAFFALSIITYPVTLFLRACGYQSKSFFSFGYEKYEAWKEARKPSSYRSDQQQQANKEHKHSEYSELKPSPWEILGVEKGASKDEIGAAFRQKMMINHPDKVANLDPALQQYATKRTILIKDAYDKLMHAT